MLSLAAMSHRLRTANGHASYRLERALLGPSGGVFRALDPVLSGDLSTGISLRLHLQVCPSQEPEVVSSQLKGRTK